MAQQTSPEMRARHSLLVGSRGKIALAVLTVVAIVCLVWIRRPVVVTFPNPNVFLSPYNWRAPGDGTIWAPLGGPYIKFSVTGTKSIKLNVDTAINSGQKPNNMPSVKVIVDDNPPAYVMFGPSATQVTLASGLSTSTHTVRLYMMGARATVPGSWTGTVAQTHIKNLQFDAGAKLSPYPVIHSKNCFILGDSFLAGYNGKAQGDADLYTVVDASATWAFQLADAVGCEVGVVGVGEQGFLWKGAGGYPHILESWNKYDATHERIFSPPPDIVIDAHGINDRNNLILPAWEGAAVQSFITSVRSALPGAKIFMYLPVGGPEEDAMGGAGANAETIKKAVADLRAPNVYVIDPGSKFVSADNWETPTWFAPNDAIHPGKAGHDALAAIAIQQVQQVLNGNAIPAATSTATAR